MSKKKFEYCYSCKHNQEFSIDDVQFRYENNHHDIGDFREDMWCPECQQAALKFTSKTHRKVAYFSALDKNSHCKGCSYNYAYIKKEQIKKYTDELSDEQISDKMRAMLNRIVKKTGNNLVQNNVNQAENNPLLVKANNTNGTQTYNAIRTKSLNTFLDKDELGDEIYLFYGKNVKLNISTKPHEFKNKETGKIQQTTLYFLNINTLSKNGEYKYKANIYLGTNKLEVNEETVYHITIIGYLDAQYGRQIQLLRRTATSISLLIEEVH